MRRPWLTIFFITSSAAPPWNAAWKIRAPPCITDGRTGLWKLYPSNDCHWAGSASRSFRAGRDENLAIGIQKECRAQDAKYCFRARCFLFQSCVDYFCVSVPKSLPTPDFRLHFTCYCNQIKIAFPPKGKTSPGEGVLDKRRTGAAAANKDHLRYDFLHILLRNAQIAGKVLCHLSRSAAILEEKRIGVHQKFLLRQNLVTPRRWHKGGLLDFQQGAGNLVGKDSGMYDPLVMDVINGVIVVWGQEVGHDPVSGEDSFPIVDLQNFYEVIEADDPVQSSGSSGVQIDCTGWGVLWIVALNRVHRQTSFLNEIKRADA